jgi:amidase
MSVQGPLARSVADVRLGLAAISCDPRDPCWVPRARPSTCHTRRFVLRYALRSKVIRSTLRYRRRCGAADWLADGFRRRAGHAAAAAETAAL